VGDIGALLVIGLLASATVDQLTLLLAHAADRMLFEKVLETSVT
jgi:hypothetical protein